MRSILTSLLIALTWMTSACSPAEDDAWDLESQVTRIDLTDEVSDRETTVVPSRPIVIWTNRGAKDHSATSLDGAWDTGRIKPGQSAAVRLEEPGDFEYTSVFDPSVKGSLHVAAE